MKQERTYIRKILFNKNKEKRKFLLAGLINFGLTNTFLQIFLISNFFNIAQSTFLSQIINMTFGYSIYSKFIFKVNSMKNIIFIKKYLFLMFLLWMINTLGIKLGSSFGISENYSALLMIPPLAFMSYLLQKIWIFVK